MNLRSLLRFRLFGGGDGDSDPDNSGDNEAPDRETSGDDNDSSES